MRTPLLRSLILCGISSCFAAQGCERGCARSWIESRRGAQSLGVSAALDCPDGLARCEGGVVSASRLATVPRRCPGPSAVCSCPWEVVGECGHGCAAEGAEVVIERALATAQLCAPGPDAAPLADPVTGPAVRCEEGQAYLCTGGAVVDCASGSPVGRCRQGCRGEAAAIDDGNVQREAAFAILCSR